MSELFKNAPIVQIRMLKGADGTGSKLSEFQNDAGFLTEEQIITLVTNIVQTGSVGNIDTGFVTRLVEQNKHKALQFWVGTQAEYDEIGELTANMFYIITDDDFKEKVAADIAAVNERIDNIDYENEIAAIFSHVDNQLESVIVRFSQADNILSGRVSSLESTTESQYYSTSAGNIYTENSNIAGYITNNKQTVNFTIPLSKRVPTGANISGVNATLRMRQNGNYICGTAEQAVTINPNDAQWTMTINPKESYANISITENMNGFPAATNNDTAGIAFELTFSVEQAVG